MKSAPNTISPRSVTDDNPDDDTDADDGGEIVGPMPINPARFRAVDDTPTAADHLAMHGRMRKSALLTEESEQWLRRAQELLTDGKTVVESAAALSMAINHFGRKFRKLAGKPPLQWLADQRIDELAASVRNRNAPAPAPTPAAEESEGADDE